MVDKKISFFFFHPICSVKGRIEFDENFFASRNQLQFNKTQLKSRPPPQNRKLITLQSSYSNPIINLINDFPSINYDNGFSNQQPSVTPYSPSQDQMPSLSLEEEEEELDLTSSADKIQEPAPKIVNVEEGPKLKEDEEIEAQKQLMELLTGPIAGSVKKKKFFLNHPSNSLN